MEDSGAAVARDEIQRATRRMRSGFGWLAVALHSFGETPPPNRQRLGSEGSLGYLVQHLGHALLFGGPNKGKRAPGFEYFANRLGRAALGSGPRLVIEQG